ncbi:helix-turn-helix domain-containing protein [Streptacidiphilus rugosus]|uniref:helix-turn-helix domain-containing protein n=1 Tax=Streptacidiphilus rugosus TaxID=405783 RepID=UPI0018DB479A
MPSGKTLGRPTALDPSTAQAVVSQYHEGAAIKALARQHGVAPRTIRRVLDADGSRTVPAPRTHETDPVPPETAPNGSTGPVTIDVPGLLATHLDAEGDEAIRGALGEGWTIRLGQGHSVRVTAALALHRAALAQCADVVQDGSASAVRKACRVYAARISAAQ